MGAAWPVTYAKDPAPRAGAVTRGETSTRLRLANGAPRMSSIGGDRSRVMRERFAADEKRKPEAHAAWTIAAHAIQKSDLEDFKNYYAFRWCRLLQQQQSASTRTATFDRRVRVATHWRSGMTMNRLIRRSMGQRSLADHRTQAKTGGTMTIEPSRRELLLAGAAAALPGGLACSRRKDSTMNPEESEVKALMDRRSEAFRLKDVERAMALFSADVVYFDLVPPLRYSGAAALRERFDDWFRRWKSPIGQELRDLTVLARGDMAAAHMLIRTSGTLNDGRTVGYWVRTSDFCLRSNGKWLITHEHVSFPVDVRSGNAVMNLAP
jgi:ketosteroid isomerase-like protein